MRFQAPRAGSSWGLQAPAGLQAPTAEDRGAGEGRVGGAICARPARGAIAATACYGPGPCFGCGRPPPPHRRRSRTTRPNGSSSTWLLPAGRPTGAELR
uniref:Uncharacterized protein n=1 Tax=Arundo donax TaxID=35708 RepID=A0A0A9C300_ARUDO